MDSNTKNNTKNNTGILDPEGVNPNPLTNLPYSEDYKKLAKIWSNFPAYQNKKYAQSLITDIIDHQVLLVVSGTGSGKTVLMPKYVLHALEYNPNKKIAVTLPKQLIAKSAAEFAAKTLDVELGKQVGYKYRGSDKRGRSKDTQLLYATDGTIVANLMNDPSLSNYQAVVIDEAHERKVQIDFLLFLLKQTLKLRPDFKIVIMSATINADIFKDYFLEFKFKQLNLSSGTNYPIESIFLREPIPPEEYITKGLEIIFNIVNNYNPSTNKNNSSKDILFFVSSVNEAKDVCERLAAFKDQNTSNMKSICIEVYSGMNKQKQEIAVRKNEVKNLIKVVVATNVAESSLTIDGIKCVIESGYEYFSSYDPEIRGRRLDKMRISRAQARQRMGRAGRTEPGICYHLYTEKEFNEMQGFPEPDIRTNDITVEALRLLSQDKIRNTKLLIDMLSKFIEPPRERYITVALDQLIRMGAIDSKDDDMKMQLMGDVLVNISSSDIQMGYSVLLSHFYNCSYEMSEIVGALDASNNNMMKFFTPPNLDAIDPSMNSNSKNQWAKKMEKKFMDAKKKFKHKNGDHLSLLKILDKYRDKKDSIQDLYSTEEKRREKIGDWAYTHFIKLDAIKKALMYSKKIKRELDKTIRIFGDRIKSNNLIKVNEDILKMEVEERIMYCLGMGLKHQVGKKNRKMVGGKSVYKTEFLNEVKINKNSFLADTNPSRVIYTEIFISQGNSELSIVGCLPNKIWDLMQ